MATKKDDFYTEENLFINPFDNAVGNASVKDWRELFKIGSGVSGSNSGQLAEIQEMRNQRTLKYYRDELRSQNPPQPQAFIKPQGFDDLPYSSQIEIYNKFIKGQMDSFNEWNKSLPKKLQHDSNEFQESLAEINADKMPQKPTRSGGEVVKDVGVGLTKGAASILGMLFNVADVVSGSRGEGSKWFAELDKDLEKLYSDFEKNHRKEIQKEIDAIHNDPKNSKLGAFFGEMGIAFKNLSVAQTAELVGNILPSLVISGGLGAAGQAIARRVAAQGLVRGTSLATGAVIQGTMSAGDAAQSAMDEVDKMSEEQIRELPGGKELLAKHNGDLQAARDELAISAGRTAALAAGALSTALQYAPGSMTRAATRLGSAFTANPVTKKAVSEAAEETAKKGLFSSVITGGVGRTALAGLEGGIEEAGTGISGRWAASREGADVDILRGAGQEFALGAIGEGGGAGVANIGTGIVTSRNEQRMAEIDRQLSEQAKANQQALGTVTVPADQTTPTGQIPSTPTAEEAAVQTPEAGVVPSAEAVTSPEVAQAVTPTTPQLNRIDPITGEVVTPQGVTSLAQANELTEAIQQRAEAYQPKVPSELAAQQATEQTAEQTQDQVKQEAKNVANVVSTEIDRRLPNITQEKANELADLIEKRISEISVPPSQRVQSQARVATDRPVTTEETAEHRKVLDDLFDKTQAIYDENQKAIAAYEESTDAEKIQQETDRATKRFEAEKQAVLDNVDSEIVKREAEAKRLLEAAKTRQAQLDADLRRRKNIEESEAARIERDRIKEDEERAKKILESVEALKKQAREVQDLNYPETIKRINERAEQARKEEAERQESETKAKQEEAETRLREQAADETTRQERAEEDRVVGEVINILNDANIAVSADTLRRIRSGDKAEIREALNGLKYKDQTPAQHDAIDNAISSLEQRAEEKQMRIDEERFPIEGSIAAEESRGKPEEALEEATRKARSEEMQPVTGVGETFTTKNKNPVSKLIRGSKNTPVTIQQVLDAARADESVGTLAVRQLGALNELYKKLGLPQPKITFHEKVTSIIDGEEVQVAASYSTINNEVLVSNKATIEDINHELSHGVFEYGLNRIYNMAKKGNQDALNKLALISYLRDLVNEAIPSTETTEGIGAGLATDMYELITNVMNPEFMAAANQIKLVEKNLPTEFDLSRFGIKKKGNVKDAYKAIKGSPSIFDTLVNLFKAIFKLISPSKPISNNTVASAIQLAALDVVEETRKAMQGEEGSATPPKAKLKDVSDETKEVIGEDGNEESQFFYEYDGDKVEIRFANPFDAEVYGYVTGNTVYNSEVKDNSLISDSIQRQAGWSRKQILDYYNTNLKQRIENKIKEEIESGSFDPDTDITVPDINRRGKRKEQVEKQVDDEDTSKPTQMVVRPSLSNVRKQAENNAVAEEFGGNEEEVSENLTSSGNQIRSVTPATLIGRLEGGLREAPLATVSEAVVQGIKRKDGSLIRQALTTVIDKINTLFHDSMAPVKDTFLSIAEDESLPLAARRAAFDCVNTMYTARGVSENAFRRFNEEFGGNDLMRNLEDLARKTGLPRSQVLQEVGEYASARFVPDATDRLIKRLQKNINKLANRVADPTLNEMEQAEAKADLKEATKMLQKVIEDYNKDDLHAESDVLMDGMNKRQAEYITSFYEKAYGKDVLEKTLQPLRRFNANKLLLDIQSGKAVPGIVAEFLERPDLLKSFNRLRQITIEEANATVNNALVLAEEREALVNSLVKQVENNYVPMHGDLLTGETFQKVQGTGKGAVQQTKFLRREGRRTMTNGLRNSLEALASSVSYTSFDPFLNHMLDMAIRMGKARGQYGIKVREVGGDRGRVSGDNVAVIRRGDKSYAIEFADKDFLKIIRKANVELSGEFVKMLSKPTRWFAYMCTTLNPLFAPFNQFKDTWERADQIAVRTNLRDANGNLIDGSKLTGAIFRESYNPAVMKACKKFVAGEVDNSPEGKLIRQIAKLGGISTMRGNFVESQASKYVTRMKTMRGVTNTALNKIAKAAEIWNGTQDLAPLLATYKVLLNQGMTVEQAVAATRDTMDFGKTGTGMPIIRMLYAFAQPAVTGGANMLGAIYDRRTGKFNRKGVARMFTYMVGISLLQALAYSMADEDEGGNVIDQQTDYVKNTSIPFQIGDEIIKFPLGFGFPRLAASMTRSMFGLASGEIDAKDAIGSAFSHGVLSNVSPVEPTGIDPYKRPLEFLLTTFVPTWMKPATEVAVNRSSLDAPITNRQWKKKDQFESEQFGYNVSEVYKDVAIEFRKLTGVDFSPESVRHLARGYLLGAFGVGLNTLVENPYKESRGKQTSMALFRQLYAPVTDASMKSQFYRGKDHIDGIKARLNAGEEISPIEEQLVRLGAKWDKIDEANKKDKAAITRNKMLSEATKEKRKRELSDGLEPYMADFVYQYRTILGKLARKTR